MSYYDKPSPPSKGVQRSQSHMNFPTGSSVCSPEIMTTLKKPISQASCFPPPPIPIPPPITSRMQENQDEEGIVYRLQGGITKLREKCKSALKTLIYWDVEKDLEDTSSLHRFEEVDIEEHCYNSEEKEQIMEKVELRSGSQGMMSKEWAKRLTDYQFLTGRDEKLPKRAAGRSSMKAKRSRRATVMVPQTSRRPSEPGYRCPKCELVVHRCCLNGVLRCEGRARRESPIPHHQLQVIPYPGYGNLQLQQFPWWVEQMTRERATEHLRLQPEGTFLIRWSDRHQKLVLSLKVSFEVKHMRVLRHEETNSFYLSEVRYFRTIDGLINYYRHNSLSECFSDLFAYLSHPLYDVAVARYSYQGSGRNHLSLEPGDRVIVISHDGESNGWWKGRIENRVGYFPKNFVTIQNDSFKNQDACDHEGKNFPASG